MTGTQNKSFAIVAEKLRTWLRLFIGLLTNTPRSTCLAIVGLSVQLTMQALKALLMALNGTPLCMTASRALLGVPTEPSVMRSPSVPPVLGTLTLLSPRWLTVALRRLMASVP